MIEVRGYVIHIAQGYYQGTIDYQKNPGVQVSSHFVISDGVKNQGDDGDIAQLVDTDVVAYTQRNGNGHWLSGENAGFVPHGLTAAQIEANAQLFARGHKEYGYPLQIATKPSDMGLGHHSMGCDYNWGHCDCPGDAIIAQKPQILNRAIEIVNGVSDMTPGESWVLHVMNYRVEALKAMRDPITVPARPDLNQTGFTEANLLAQALENIQAVDVDELAAAIIAGLPPTSLTVQDVKDACTEVINAIHPIQIVSG